MCASSVPDKFCSSRELKTSFVAVMPGYQLSPFDVGQVKAHLHYGLTAAAIARVMVKPDGKTHWGDDAIMAAVEKLEANPCWRGERQAGSGAPRKTTEKDDKSLVRHVLQKRGRKKVTVKSVKQKFPRLRKSFVLVCKGASDFSWFCVSEQRGHV